MFVEDLDLELDEKKQLYSYQKIDIDAIFQRIDNAPLNHHLLYQLQQSKNNRLGLAIP